jgi:Yip1 domain
LINLVLTPIYSPLSACSYGLASYNMLVRFLVSPQNAGFEATLRVSSYASVIQLISWLSILGELVALVLGAVLSTLGIREKHATTTGKAALVVLIAVAVAIFIVLLITAVVSAVLFSIFSIISVVSL